MAVFVPLMSGAQVEIFHSIDTQIIENRLWFAYDNPPFGTTELQGLTDGVAAWWTALLLPGLSIRLNTLTVAARDWSGGAPGPYVITNVSALGGINAESHTANVAIAVPFKWPLTVRLKRNKNYVAGIPRDGIDLNTPTVTMSEYLYEGYSALIDAARLFYPVLNWRWVVASQYDAGVARPEQLWHTCQGPPPADTFRVGQRRKRMP